MSAPYPTTEAIEVQEVDGRARLLERIRELDAQLATALAMLEAMGARIEELETTVKLGMRPWSKGRRRER